MRFRGRKQLKNNEDIFAGVHPGLADRPGGPGESVPMAPVKARRRMEMRVGLRPAAAILVAIVLSQALSGCYLPIRFDAEIEITRNGYYEIFFDGYVTEVTLFDALRRRALSPDEEQERADNVIKGL